MIWLRKITKLIIRDYCLNFTMFDLSINIDSIIFNNSDNLIYCIFNDDSYFIKML